jgi:hypothetical protein
MEPEAMLLRLREAWPREPRKERWLAAIVLLLLTAAVHYDVVFLGRSLDLTNHLNPLDFRPTPENYGPQFVVPDVWSSRNLVSVANIQDPGATWSRGSRESNSFTKH